MSSAYTDFPFALANGVRLLVLDVDGVLTRGAILMDDDGRESKGFHVRDGHGIKLLQRAGIGVGILTGRSSGVVAHRAQDLGISCVVQGSLRKAEGLDQLCSMAGIGPEQCAYMGDDVVDLPAMRRCRLMLAPRDAHPSVLGTAHWRSGFDGGAGAVRQACEGLILSNGAWPQVMQAAYGLAPADCGWPT